MPTVAHHKVTLSLAQPPPQITRVSAGLTRDGFTDLTLDLNLADSTQSASGSFADVPIGTWHLEVEAFDGSDVVRFRGETDINVLSGQTVEVDLELLPTTGSINIRVRWGSQNLLVNGSFEAGVDPGPLSQDLSAGSTNITGWVVTPVSIGYTTGFWFASHGERSLDLDGAAPGGIAQSFATEIGSTYIVSFDLAGNPDPSPPVKLLRVLAAGQHADFTFDTTGRTVQDMGWVVRNWSFMADSTTTTLEFRSMNDPSSGRGPALDNVIVRRGL